MALTDDPDGSKVSGGQITLLDAEEEAPPVSPHHTWARVIRLCEEWIRIQLEEQFPISRPAPTRLDEIRMPQHPVFRSVPPPQPLKLSDLLYQIVPMGKPSVNLRPVE